MNWWVEKRIKWLKKWRSNVVVRRYEIEADLAQVINKQIKLEKEIKRLERLNK